MVRELSQRAYPEIGVPDAHHPLSHHRNLPENIEKLTKIASDRQIEMRHRLLRLDEPFGDDAAHAHVQPPNTWSIVKSCTFANRCAYFAATFSSRGR